MLAQETNGVVSVGIIASLMFSRGLPCKVATNAAATFRPKGQRLSLSPVLEVCCRESTRTRWGGRPVHWPVEHEVGEKPGSETRPGDAPGGANPSGGQLPRFPLRCLPVTPLCVLPRRGLTSRSYNRERRAAGRTRLPPLYCGERRCRRKTEVVGSPDAPHGCGGSSTVPSMSVVSSDAS